MNSNFLASDKFVFNVERDIVDLDPLQPSGRDPERGAAAFRRSNETSM
jgi:hypothetical protein